MTNFEGLVAVVTGGSSGIGAAIVAELASRGATAISLDLQAPNDDVAWQHCDVADDTSVEDAITAVVDQYGRLDLVVNNAGVGAQGDITANSSEEWLKVWNINVVGMVRVARSALPYLRQSSSASITNTASIASTAGLPQRALYSATKGAVLALTQAMAADHLREGIRVNCVAPGTADTPWIQRLLINAPDPVAERAALENRQPHGRLVAADEVARAVAYLADPSNRSTVGVCLAVDGGMQALRLRGTGENG